MRKFYLVAMQRKVQLAALIVRHAGERWTRQRIAIRSQLCLHAVNRTLAQTISMPAQHNFPFS